MTASVRPFRVNCFVFGLDCPAFRMKLHNLSTYELRSLRGRFVMTISDDGTFVPPKTFTEICPSEDSESASPSFAIRTFFKLWDGESAFGDA